MSSAKFHFLKIIQKVKHKILAMSMMGKAIPIKEKKDVLKGDIYHAGKDNKSNIMAMVVLPSTIALIIFFTIENARLYYFSPASNN